MNSPDRLLQGMLGSLGGALGTTTTGSWANTIKFADYSSGYLTISDSASCQNPQPVAKPPNRAWLDKRVEEIRVKL